ncbi:glycosyltransferase family 4 protein [Massilibacterium senegalense]|uniref:glycosyltransferase family 4 protein n=1 Tax=Massilibacterium senegalense TaxID=1632858 RepID=UPI000783F609|nr:MraY family glycosyltransferase [Massilibacterium senegalense]
MEQYFIALMISFIAAVLFTPLVKKLAIKIGAVDKPNDRKVHQGVMPRLGGLAIFLAVAVGVIYFQPISPFFLPIMLGAFIIIVTGILDDLFELSPKLKLIGQIVAASVVILGGIKVEFINLPFDGRLELGLFTIPLTLLWIIGVTNAINLIDGLDGLSAGVSSIVLATIATMAYVNGNFFVLGLSMIMLGASLGFLIFNFHPAKIFMGDTGSLFLGFMLSVLSLLGFKNITLFSLLVPAMILAVPISDTLFAIIRRAVNRKPLSAPDKSHLHHCLLRLGYSHRQTVLMIYAMSAFFSLCAILFSQTTLWVSVAIILIVLFIIEIIIELVGLVDEEYKPLLKFLRRVFPKREGLSHKK